ncbi:MAG TPA: N-acetylglucosamine-6-phosphate deacetylase [Candidatus Binataceae bacterium]|nr:N-acetylglucosamine-6-phosphate deacetylase [Candidatus Binataceae bacterium]
MPTSGRAVADLHQLSGHLDSSGQSRTVVFGETVTAICERHAPLDDVVLPGFIDLQVNGAYGIDVMSASIEDVLRLSYALAREGTTSWLPTVITAPLETIERCDAMIAAAMTRQREAAQSPSDARKLSGATILGMHLEGPFISPRHLGAHPPLQRLPHGEALARMLALKTLRLITLAPELDGALGAIRQFVARGVTVSLGHSDATCDEALAAVAVGARMFTHLFNAMRPLHHREPGIVGAALTPSPAAAAIIPDRVHIHPAMFALVRAARTVGQTLVASDCVALAGVQPDAELPMFGDASRRVQVREGAARFPDGALAGGVVTMLEGLRLTVNDPVFGGGLDPFGYAQMAAEGPARVLGLADRGAVALGKRADLILLDRALNLKAVFVDGHEID